MSEFPLQPGKQTLRDFNLSSIQLAVDLEKVSLSLDVILNILNKKSPAGHRFFANFGFLGWVHCVLVV